MRPLQKIMPVLTQQNYEIHNVLMNVVGDFCSLCERKLYDVALVWNKETGSFVSGPMSLKHWDQLLVVCHNCAGNYSVNKADPRHLLLPDEYVTFRLEGVSPYVYGLTPVTTKMLDEEGQLISEKQEEAVIVSGTTDEAEQTIRAFALNTAYFDSATAVFSIPYKAYLSLEDRRVEQRTKVWHDALALGQAILAAGNNTSMLQVLLTNVRHQIVAVGYWSTWITALHTLGISKDILAEILLIKPEVKETESEPGSLKALAFEEELTIRGPGSHNPMPGTNTRWMEKA